MDKKAVMLGRGPYGRIFCTIEVKEKEGKGKCLSICGVEGPKTGGDAIGGCGQIHSDVKGYLSQVEFAYGWDHWLAVTFLAVWQRWHLNDMRAGTPKQMDLLREMDLGSGKWYDNACHTLKLAGLYEDEHPETGKPYKFGHEWLFEEVPAYVWAFLEKLPASLEQNPWRS